MTSLQSPFSAIEQAPPDPILGLTEAFNKDPNPNKVNLGVGVYQDARGKVPVLSVVKEAEALWLEQENSKTYLPIDGAPGYHRAVQGLLFGPGSDAIGDGRAITIQALGGTGALRVGADFLRKFFPDSGVWISDPSWENHRALFESCGFSVHAYPYYDPATHGLDFGRMLDALRELPERSIVVLHAACHNPTGVDLSAEQWEQIIPILERRAVIPYLDFAYQGFGAGIVEDAFAVRAFASAGIPCLIASSFSKSFSIYRERVGALTILSRDSAESRRLLSQFKRVVRTNYSSPPSHGAQVVALVLNDETLRPRWEHELAGMRERIWKMRSLLVETLEQKGAGRDFRFIERQRGMFSYSGIPKDVVLRLREEKGLYIVDSGRICVAAINEQNLEYICESISDALNAG